MADYSFNGMKDVIADKFFEISRTKSIEKITVTEVVKACKISRQAFYYHFHDIVDLIIWLSHKKIRSVLEFSRRAEHAEDAIKALVSFFSEYHEMNKRRMGAQVYQQFEELTYQDLRTFLRGIAQHSGSVVACSDFEAALEFCTGGVYKMLLTYTGKSAETDAWLTHKLYQLIKGELSLI